jgi:thioredoxin-related protein
VRPFVPLRLDFTDTEGDGELYAQQYQLAGVPTIVLFDGSGRKVASFVGFKDPATLAGALRAAAAE